MKNSLLSKIVIVLFLISFVFRQDKIPNLRLKMINGKYAKLHDFLKDGPMIIDFWATWCAPCKEEMPSLDLLQKNEYLKNLKILPINVGQENMEKASNFFKDLEIKNLDFYYDSSITLAKKFGLRGIPTTILFNKDGFEFARIVGSINFQNKEFIEWLSNYN